MYKWSIERNGLTVLAEFDLLGNEHKLTEIPSPPYRIHALPTDRSMPCFYMDIDAGQEYIWEHRGCTSVALFSPDVIERPYIGTILGRRCPDGREEVVVILPSGQHTACGSLDEARRILSAP